MTTVMAFGTFDYFHAGHESYLTQAKALGETLIVIIARDETVQRIKGRHPDHNEKMRLKVVRDSRLADKVALGSLADKYDVLRRFKPDVIALGYDQFTFTFQLKKFLINEHMDSKIVRLEAYRAEVYKSSLIKAAAAV